MVATRHMESEKDSLPVDVRRSTTSLLKDSLIPPPPPPPRKKKSDRERLGTRQSKSRERKKGSAGRMRLKKQTSCEKYLGPRL